MAPLSQSQFHLASNLKNKPNAQGTLFSANPSQRTPESRQPRGYSPEREQAVGSALSLRRASTVAGGYLAAERAQVRQTVARSTIPLADIRSGHPIMRVSPVYDDYKGLPRGAAGVYYRGDDNNGEDPQIKVLPKYAHTYVPIHELGHHVDRNSPYHTPQEKGRAEGFADAYADTHAKKPGYKSRPATTVPRDHNSYGVWTQGMSPGMASAFDERYQKARYGQTQGPLQPAQFSHQVPGEDGLPKNHVRGQNRLLEKISHVGWGPDATGPKWDYVQDYDR